MSAEIAYASERFRREPARPPVVAPSKRARFEEIFNRHQRAARRVIASVLVDPDRVDDVLQEACIKAYRRLPERFANQAHEAAWFCRVAYRTSLDEVRRRNRSRQVLADEASLCAVTTDDVESRLALADLFRALPESERAALVLVVALGFDYSTAAEILGAPVGTVAWRVNAARAKFRRELLPRGGPDGKQA